MDAGMRLGCNQPIGPLALADLIGLDTVVAILETLCEGFNHSKYRPAPLLKEMVAAGYLGRKQDLVFTFTHEHHQRLKPNLCASSEEDHCSNSMKSY